MKNNLVVKHNELIEARYNLTLNEQKIILYAVSNLDRSKEKFNILSLNIRDFFGLLGTTQERYTEVREIAKNLISKTLVIKKEDSELVTSWLSSMEYMEDSGIVELEFSEKLIPYLLQLKEKFTRYELCNILNLKNKYSIRIYELMKQYEKIKKRKISIIDLKKYLGIKEDEYERIFDFERFVLKPAKEEINQHTDILIDYEKIKKGRKIDSILFTIKAKDIEKERYIEFLNDNYSIEEIKLKMGLENENFNSEQIMNLYEKSLQKVESEGIDPLKYIAINYLFIKDKARDRYNYLLKAINDDYAKAVAQMKLNYYL